VQTRRIAAFLLGAWLAGCLLVMFMSLQIEGATTKILTFPVPAAEKMLNTLGRDNSSMLLHHVAQESIRMARHNWELIELGLAILLGMCLFLATQRRILPMVLGGAMFVLVIFQHFGISPELAYRGEVTDFPPGNAQLGPREKYLAMDEIFYAAEIVKLAIGGILGSYLFVFRARRSRKEIDAIDDPKYRHVNR